MRRLLASCVSLFALPLAFACATSDRDPTPEVRPTPPSDRDPAPEVRPTPPSDRDPAPEVRSTLPYDAHPAVSETELRGLTRANNAFAFEMYAKLAQEAPTAEAKTLFFSPHSISTALAMTYAGARGATATEMASALHYELPQDRLHPAFNALSRALASRAETDNGGFKLKIANSLWASKTVAFAPLFLDTLSTSYDTGVKVADFQGQPETARASINEWVEDATENRIKDLLGADSITSATRVVLVNALYFNARWAEPFFASETKPRPFHAPAGVVNVDTMFNRLDAAYTKADGYEAVEVPYEGGKVAFDIVAPDNGTLAAFEATLDGNRIETILGSLKPTLLDLHLPKLDAAAPTIKLKPVLAGLGMTSAFDNADFSGITSEALKLDDVHHKAFLKLDEKGTEAAAATAVVAIDSSAPMPRTATPVAIDRPFIFFIRDIPTGAILFVGRTVDPRG